MTRFALTSTVVVVALLNTGTVARADNLWPVPNSPLPEAWGTATTTSFPTKTTDPYTGRKYTVHYTTLSCTIHGLESGAPYTLNAYDRYGQRSGHIDFYGDPDGTTFAEVSWFGLSRPRHAYYEVWGYDELNNPVLVLSSQ